MIYQHDLTFGDWVTNNDPSADVALHTGREDTSVSVFGKDVSLYVMDDDGDFGEPVVMSAKEAIDLAFTLLRAADYARRYKRAIKGD